MWKRKKSVIGKSGVFLAVIVLLCGLSVAAQATDGAVLIYGGLENLSADGFQRLLQTDSIRYVCFQHGATSSGVSSMAAERAAELKDAGKRLVLQIWWGPCGDYPWSTYIGHQ